MDLELKQHLFIQFLAEERGSLLNGVQTVLEYQKNLSQNF